jgi:RNA polymerase sigma-70 factor (ECF subfamily)
MDYGQLTTDTPTGEPFHPSNSLFIGEGFLLVRCGLTNSRATELFYKIVWPLRAVVLRAARIQTGNETEADDLAQETLLKAFKAIGSFRSGTNTRAWLMTILRNTRIDRLRTKSGSTPMHSLDEVLDEPIADESTAEPDWTNPQQMLAEFSDATVIEALSSISEELRWTLLLVDVEQLDHADAAAILGVPVGTVKSRVHRGHAAVRQALLSSGASIGVRRES